MNTSKTGNSGNTRNGNNIRTVVKGNNTLTVLPAGPRLPPRMKNPPNYNIQKNNNIKNTNSNLHFNNSSYYNNKGLFTSTKKPKIVFLKKKLSGTVLSLTKVKKLFNDINLDTLGDYYKINISKSEDYKLGRKFELNMIDWLKDNYYILAEMKNRLKVLSIDKQDINSSTIKGKTFSQFKEKNVYFYPLYDENEIKINNLNIVLINTIKDEQGIIHQFPEFYLLIKSFPNKNN